MSINANDENKIVPKYHAVEYSGYWYIQESPFYGEKNLLDAEDVGEEEAEKNAKQIADLLNGEKDKRIDELEAFLKHHEQWEADFIADNNQWWPNKNKDTLNGKVYEGFLELQEKRNQLLNKK